MVVVVLIFGAWLIFLLMVYAAATMWHEHKSKMKLFAPDKDNIKLEKWSSAGNISPPEPEIHKCTWPSLNTTSSYHSCTTRYTKAYDFKEKEELYPGEIITCNECGEQRILKLLPTPEPPEETLSSVFGEHYHQAEILDSYHKWLNWQWVTFEKYLETLEEVKA